MDMYSDFKLMIAIFIAMQCLGASIFGIEVLPSKVNQTLIMQECQIQEEQVFELQCNFLRRFFKNYFSSLLSIFILSILGQYAVYQRILFTIRHKLCCYKWFVCAMSPVTNFRHMYSAQKKMQNPKYEDRTSIDEKCLKDQTLCLEKNAGVISESFIESQATCRFAISCYIAFSYVVSTEKWKKADCIARNILQENQGIITFNNTVNTSLDTPFDFIFSNSTQARWVCTVKHFNFEENHHITAFSNVITE